MYFISLLQVIRACSFTFNDGVNANQEYPLNYYNLPSKDALIRELQDCLFPMGMPLQIVPDLNVVVAWMRERRVKGEYDPKAARFMWLQAMDLYGFDRDEEVKNFLWFAIDEHQDSILIEDYVNYRRNIRYIDTDEQCLHVQYLKKYRLRHCTYLPADLIQCAEELNEDDLSFLAHEHLATILLSRHTRNHGVIRNDFYLDYYTPKLLHFALYSRMIYDGQPFQIIRGLGADVNIINVMKDFGQTHNCSLYPWLTEQPDSTKAIASLVISGIDLPGNIWFEEICTFLEKNEVIRTNNAESLRSSRFPSLLHHLLHHQKDWIREHIYGVPAYLVTSYLMQYPDDAPLIPTPMPPITAIIPIRDDYPVTMAPIFERLVQIYGSMGLEQAIRTHNVMYTAGYSYKVLACIRLVDGSFYQKFGGENSKLNNNLMVVISKTCNVLSEEEQGGWINYFMTHNQPSWVPTVEIVDEE